MTRVVNPITGMPDEIGVDGNVAVGQHMYPNCQYVATQAIDDLTDSTHWDLQGNVLAVNDRGLAPLPGTYCTILIWNGTSWEVDASFGAVEGCTVTAVRSAGSPTYRQTAITGNETAVFDLVQSGGGLYFETQSEMVGTHASNGVTALCVETAILYVAVASGRGTPTGTDYLTGTGNDWAKINTVSIVNTPGYLQGLIGVWERLSPGVVTLQSGSDALLTTGGSDIAAWSTLGTYTSITADTIGTKYLEDTSVGFHFVYSTIGGLTGPATQIVKIKPVGTRTVFILCAASGASLSAYDTAGGVCKAVTADGQTPSISGPDGDGFYTLKNLIPAGFTQMVISGADSYATPDRSYTGGGSTCGFIAYLPHIDNSRVATLEDVEPSGDYPAGKLAPYNFTQAVEADQIFVRASDLWVPSDNATHTLVNTDAEFCAAFETAKPITVTFEVTVLSTPTGNIELLKAAGASNSVTFGIDTSRCPYIAGSGMSTITGTALTLGVQARITYVMTGTTASIYVNGTSVVGPSAAVLSTLATATVTKTLRCAAEDVMAINDVALSSSDISAVAALIAANHVYPLV